jgi:uncharacterized membrane protein HdeD (DUF308 family)
MDENQGPLQGLEDEVMSTLKHWWLFILIGLLGIGIGIWILCNTGKAYVALSIFFAITFIIAGIASCWITITNRKLIPAWGWQLCSGIIMLVLGILLVAIPNLSEEAMIVYVAFAIVFAGIDAVFLSFTLRGLGDPAWGWNLFFGILSAIVGFLLLAHPLVAVLTIVMLSGIGFICAGFAFCSIGFRLSKLNAWTKR